MKFMKSKIILPCLVVLAALIMAAIPTQTNALAWIETRLPPNQTESANHKECLVTLRHGNIYGAAYAKFTVDMTTEKTCDVSVRVTGWNNNRIVQGSSCSIARCSASADGWYQSTARMSNLLGSEVRVCPPRGLCKTFVFRAV